MKITILGLGGSLRPNSHTSKVLQIALGGAREAGAQTQLLDLATLRLPLFNGTYCLDGYTSTEHEAILTLLQTVDDAQGIILASPTYHNTVSGALKNALDLLELLTEDRPSRFDGKPVGLVSVQGGTSGTGINTLTTMLLAARGLGAWVIPTMVNVLDADNAFDDNELRNPALQQRLHTLGAEVTRASEMFAAHWRIIV